MDTIFATATALGRSGVAIVRVSGPKAHESVQRLTGSIPEVRKASVRKIVNASGETIDDGVVLVFPRPNSFTGEDVAEFQIHGGIAVVQALLDALQEIQGLRLAEAGEFTRRALENGRLDLTEVEGLADLIDAETEAQRRQAQRLVEGSLTHQVEQWRKSLIRAAALLEATIDFADEDVPEDVLVEVSEILENLSTSLSQEAKGSYVAERLRNGFEVAIIGPPNAGKSTLLNALAGREVAITSGVAGTTRDVIEVRMDLAGIPVTILDTAGLREAQDSVERIGIQRALERAEAADLRVFLGEGVQFLAPTGEDIVLQAKADLLENPQNGVSGLTGLGVDVLVERLQKIFAGRVQSVGTAVRTRHRIAVENGNKRVSAAQGLLQQGLELSDLAAEELRSAARELEVLVGRIDVEGLLDEIFLSFCLGK